MTRIGFTVADRGSTHWCVGWAKACQLRGCDPKKVLVGVSELTDWGRRMQGKGASATAPTLAWPELIRFKRTFVDGVPAAMDESFKHAGMLTVHGRARFVAATSLRVGDEIHFGDRLPE